MSTRDVIIKIKTLADKKGLDDTEKGIESLGKKTEKTSGILGGLTNKLSSFGGDLAKNVTGGMGAAGKATDDVVDSLGAMSGVAGAAAAGVLGLGTALIGGVKKLGELYDNTRAFNEVAGTSWEEGSKLIAVADDLRVSADEAAGAMGKFTKTVGTSPGTLAEYGIEIAHAKDGTVDMLGTLENAATAFQNTVDPAKRAALGSALFGKSWQNMVPILDQGGDKLRELVAGVDKSQIASEKGAKQQDKLYEATDNLSDAMAGLQMRMAQDLLPTLISLAETGTTVVGIFGKLQDAAAKISPDFDPDDEKKMAALRKNYNETAKEIFSLKELFTDFSVGDPEKTQRVADATKDSADAHKLLLSSMLPTIPASADLKAVMESSETALARQKQLSKEAADEYKKFEDKIKSLLQAQEDMREAQLETEDTGLAYEKAQIAAGDASGELSDKAKLAAEAVEQHGADSEEAKIATENYRRALLDARGAMDASADAAVNNAAKIAEGNGVVLTAAEKIQIYRDEMIRLQGGAADPGLHSALQSVIDKYAELARQAQNAKENAQGLNEAIFAKGGGETNFTSRDASGGAVVRRATGGPVWPGRTYMVGEHGPELLNLPAGSGPGNVLSSAQTSQIGGDWPSLSGAKGSSPTVTYDAAGNIVGIAAPQTFGPPTVSSPLGSGLAFPSLGRSPSGFQTVPSGSGVATIPGASFPSSGGTSAAAGSGRVSIFNITINGYADIKKLVDAIRRYEAANK